MLLFFLHCSFHRPPSDVLSVKWQVRVTRSPDSAVIFRGVCHTLRFNPHTHPTETQSKAVKFGVLRKVGVKNDVNVVFVDNLTERFFLDEFQYCSKTFRIFFFFYNFNLQYYQHTLKK